MRLGGRLYRLILPAATRDAIPSAVHHIVSLAS